MLKGLVQFVASGAIVVLASYAAPKFGQRWAGLIVAAPLLTLITFLFLSLDSSNGNLKEYLTAALVFMVPAAVFILALLLLVNRVHFMLNILISFGVYALVVFIMHKLNLAR